MNNDIQQLQTQVKELQQKIDSLQLSLSNHSHNGNNSPRINFSDLFSVGPQTTPYGTNTTSFGSGGGSVTAPAQPSGTLAIIVDNITYNILYK